MRNYSILFLFLTGGLEPWTFIFPDIGNNNPNWLSYFSEGLKPPTRLMILWWSWESMKSQMESEYWQWHRNGWKLQCYTGIYILDPHVNSHGVVFDFGGQLGFGNAQVGDPVVLPRTLTLLDNPNGTCFVWWPLRVPDIINFTRIHGLTPRLHQLITCPLDPQTQPLPKRIRTKKNSIQWFLSP